MSIVIRHLKCSSPSFLRKMSLIFINKNINMKYEIGKVPFWWLHTCILQVGRLGLIHLILQIAEISEELPALLPASDRSERRAERLVERSVQRVPDRAPERGNERGSTEAPPPYHIAVLLPGRAAAPPPAYSAISQPDEFIIQPAEYIIQLGHPAELIAQLRQLTEFDFLPNVGCCHSESIRSTYRRFFTCSQYSQYGYCKYSFS